MGTLVAPNLSCPRRKDTVMTKQRATSYAYRCSKHFFCKGLSYFSIGTLFFVGASIPFLMGVAGDEDGSNLLTTTQLSLDAKKLEKSTLSPRIAIVIDDLGPNRLLTERAILLPNSISLAFLPNSHSNTDLATRAIEDGHEVLIHMPMEPLDSSIDPGPGALLLTMTLKEILYQLRAAFTQMPGAIGLNNHMGSKFTQDANAMATLMGELKARNMIFLDSRTTPATKGNIIARKKKVKTISRNIFLDNDRSKIAIRKQLFLAEKFAQKNGVAVVIGHPYPETFLVLEEWIPDAVMRGYTLVQISAVVQ